jgi:hypothetical protein
VIRSVSTSDTVKYSLERFVQLCVFGGGAPFSVRLDFPENDLRAVVFV